MRKTIILLSLTLVSLTSICQDKKDSTVKPTVNPVKQPTDMSVTLKFQDWQTVIDALYKFPYEKVSPIIDEITKKYLITVNPKKP